MRRDDRGQDAVEYDLLIVVISLSLVAGMILFGDSLVAAFETAAERFADLAWGGGPGPEPPGGGPPGGGPPGGGPPGGGPPGGGPPGGGPPGGGPPGGGPPGGGPPGGGPPGGN